MKKNKIINIIVGVALCISLCGNVYLFQRLDINDEAIAAMSNQVIESDDQIDSLEQQLTDLESQISDLQAQLNQSSNKITNLEESLQTSEAEKADLETKISDLETQISDKEAVIAGLEAQHQSSTVTTNTTTQQIHQPTTGAMPGGTMGDITWTTGGDGSVANGHFGHYE